MNRSPVHSDPALGEPRPGRVVGLSAGVPEFDELVADGEVEGLPVGVVRIAVLGRPLAVRRPELPAVDDAVVAGGEPVAVEPQAARSVGHRRWAASAGRPASSSNGPTPNTWSMWPWEKIAVCRRSGVHAADRAVDPAGRRGVARVDHQQPPSVDTAVTLREGMEEGDAARRPRPARLSRPAGARRRPGAPPSRRARRPPGPPSGRHERRPAAAVSPRRNTERKQVVAPAQLRRRTGEPDLAAFHEVGAAAPRPGPGRRAGRPARPTGRRR